MNVSDIFSFIFGRFNQEKERANAAHIIIIQFLQCSILNRRARMANLFNEAAIGIARVQPSPNWLARDHYYRTMMRTLADEDRNNLTRKV